MNRIQTDCAIIGGGPAGWQQPVEAHKAGLDTLIIERDLPLAVFCSSVSTMALACCGLNAA